VKAAAEKKIKEESGKWAVVESFLHYFFCTCSNLIQVELGIIKAAKTAKPAEEIKAEVKSGTHNFHKGQVMWEHLSNFTYHHVL
jgi:hypothetical protein